MHLYEAGSRFEYFSTKIIYDVDRDLPERFVLGWFCDIYLK